MAQKKGLMYRLTMGRDDNPDLTVEKLPGTRWAVFKDVLGLRFGALVKINLLMLLFALPAIFWLFLNNMVKLSSSSFINYTGNYGFGYPLVTDAIQAGQLYNWQMDLMSGLIFIPLLMFASIGLAGGFHTIKLLVWGEGISVFQTFFKGIKANILPFALSALFLGLGFFFVRINMSSYGVIDINRIVATITYVMSVILFVLLVFMALFLFTQAVTYKLKVRGLIKNSFLFAIGMLVQNIFFVGITAIPLLLISWLGMQFGMFIMLFYAIIGLSMTVLIWTIYAHYVFDKFLNEKIEGAIKDRGIYRRSQEEKEQARKDAEERRKKSANVKYVNPKKKKSNRSIDEDKGFTPLATTFSRTDLKRMEEEKRSMKDDYDDEEEEDIDLNDKDIDLNDGDLDITDSGAEADDEQDDTQ